MPKIAKFLIMAGVVLCGGAGAAFADCAADLAKLDAALKTPALAADAKTALQDARTKADEFAKKKDDKACNKVISDAMAKAGQKM